VFKDAVQRLRDVLVKRGHLVLYEEVPGAEHEFIHWRSKLGDGLIYLTSAWGQGGH
jgi:enterochelin esterase-like enzyme